MALLQKDWLSPCRMERVITHWTVGRHTANDFEREHYHFLIEGNNAIVRGARSIADNVATGDGVYAAHTLGANGGSIGVALCGMIGTIESPFVPGSEPVTKSQYLTMAHVVAELCDYYKIAVSPETVLGHGEVQANLGIKQRGKWDPMVLPWDQAQTAELFRLSERRSYAEVGNYFRTLVRRAMRGEPLETNITVDALRRVPAIIRGKTFPDAVLEDGSSYVKLQPIAKAFGWKTAKAGDNAVAVTIGDKPPVTLPTKLYAGSGYVSVRALAAAMGFAPGWDAKTRTVTIA